MISICMNKPYPNLPVMMTIKRQGILYWYRIPQLYLRNLGGVFTTLVIGKNCLAHGEDSLTSM